MNRVSEVILDATNTIRETRGIISDVADSIPWIKCLPDLAEWADEEIGLQMIRALGAKQ